MASLRSWTAPAIYRKSRSPTRSIGSCAISSIDQAARGVAATRLPLPQVNGGLALRAQQSATALPKTAASSSNRDRLLRRHHRVDGATVAHEVSMRDDELLERGLDIVEQDIGDEAIDACIDAGGLIPMHIAIRRD